MYFSLVFTMEPIVLLFLYIESIVNSIKVNSLFSYGIASKGVVYCVGRTFMAEVLLKRNRPPAKLETHSDQSTLTMQELTRARHDLGQCLLVNYLYRLP